MICPSCGYDNNEDGQYCSQCGLPLAIDGESAEVAKQPSPKLSKVVPYVIPGQETGFIPRYNADRDPDPADFQAEEGADQILAQGPFSAQGQQVQCALDDVDEEGPVESAAAEEPEADAGLEAEGHEAVEGPEAAESEALAGLGAESEAPENPEAADSESNAEERDQDEAEASEEGACEEDAALCEEQGPAAIDGPADAEEAQDLEGAGNAALLSGEVVSDGADPDRRTAPAGMVSWDKEFPTVQITALMPEVAEEEEDPASDDAACDEMPNNTPDEDDALAEAVEAQHEGDAADPEGEEADASVSESDEDAEDDSEADSDNADSDADSSADDDYMPVGKHSKSVDRSAETVKMDRVPKPGPGSTAVIPSISVSGPTRYSDADRDRADAKRKKRTRTMAITAIVAVVVIFAMFFGVRSCSTGTTVPDVVNTSTREARARLDAAGFEVQVESKVTDEAEDGTVLACDPSCGSKQRKGSMVTLTVAASQTIPDVVGMDLDSARNMLEEQGAKNVKVEAKESNQPENTVIAVSPETGKPFSPDDDITLTVATTAYLPNVVGAEQEYAKSILVEAGYEPEVEWVESDQPAGIVIATDPEANSLANLGSTVALTVSSPGPSNFMHIMEYFNASSSNLSEYLKWKGFSVSGSYIYTDEWSGTEYVSQVWGGSDKCTVSFTPAPYIEDKGLDPVDYMAQDKPFQAVRIFIPKDSSLSLGTDLSMSNVKKYMDACGLQNLSDSCTKDDMEYNGKSGKEMGMDDFVCAQGEMNRMVWTILITEKGTYIGAGGFQSYPDMDPIADCVAVNEMFSAKTVQ